jgi:hypothetical protein
MPGILGNLSDRRQFFASQPCLIDAISLDEDEIGSSRMAGIIILKRPVTNNRDAGKHSNFSLGRHRQGQASGTLCP